MFSYGVVCSAPLSDAEERQMAEGKEFGVSF